MEEHATEPQTRGALAELDRAVVAGRDDLVALVRELVAFPTLSPPGRNTAAAQAAVAARLRALGCAVDTFAVYPGDPDVVGRLAGAGGGRALLFNGHIDVAEVGGEGWRSPPTTRRPGRGWPMPE